MQLYASTRLKPVVKKTSFSVFFALNCQFGPLQLKLKHLTCSFVPTSFKPALMFFKANVCQIVPFTVTRM